MRIIRTAIIGLGDIAHGYEDIPSVAKRIKFPTHLSVLKKDKRFSLVAGSDIIKNSRTVFQQKVPYANIYSDHIEMVKKENPDLLVIASPTKTHYKICVDVIRAGAKAILCEKPISYSLKEATELIKIARKNNVALMFNYFRGFDSGYNRLMSMIACKELGEIRGVNVGYSNGIFNNATHLINLLEKLFQPIDKVLPVDLNSIQSVDDPVVSFVGQFGQNVAFFRGLDQADYRIFEIDLFFSKERIKIVSDKLEEWKIFTEDDFSFLRLAKKTDFKIDINRSFLDVYDNIYAHLVNNTKLLSTPEDAWHALAVASAAIKACKYGQSQKIPNKIIV